MLSSEQVKFLEKNDILVFSTASEDAQPRAIFVEASRFDSNQIIITDNYMKITEQNLHANPKVFLLAYSKDYEKCLNIEGIASYETEGENFEFVKNSEQNEGFSPKAAVVIKITSATESE